jgi:hypothetical protein
VTRSAWVHSSASFLLAFCSCVERVSSLNPQMDEPLISLRTPWAIHAPVYFRVYRFEASQGTRPVSKFYMFQRVRSSLPRQQTEQHQCFERLITLFIGEKQSMLHSHSSKQIKQRSIPSPLRVMLVPRSTRPPGVLPHHRTAHHTSPITTERSAPPPRKE